MMLRICYCISHYHPIASGAERQAHRQAVELVRRGHRVHVLTRAVADRPECEEVDGVAIWRQIRPVELGPGFGLSFVATLCRGLWRLRREFDVMHCHQALWEAVASGVMCGRLGKPSVVQPAAGGEFGEVCQLGRTRGRGLLRRWILHNSHFVAISGQIEQELRELGVPAARLTRLASGVDTVEFAPGSSSVEHALPPRPRVMFLGRLHAQKNLRVLLQAWPAVRRDVPAVLLLVGDGPDSEPLRELARTLGVADSVCFLGPVANPRDYLRAADAFVLPSVAEGMSNSLLEAMAVGVPAAVSRIGGNDDLVRHEESGLLVDAGDVAGWSRAIVRLLTDQARARQMGRAARELVEQRFSITEIVDRYVALYEWLLAGGGASSSGSF